jgi:hypothetical protein
MVLSARRRPLDLRLAHRPAFYIGDLNGLVNDLGRHLGHVHEVAVVVLGQAELSDRGLGSAVRIRTALLMVFAGLQQLAFGPPFH